jgi:hypothetical protein
MLNLTTNRLEKTKLVSSDDSYGYSCGKLVVLKVQGGFPPKKLKDGSISPLKKYFFFVNFEDSPLADGLSFPQALAAFCATSKPRTTTGLSKWFIFA